ncbi:MAG: TIGR01244 family phosphatase [Sphingomonadales bacterium]|nr:TIGR01244 family phosphatase [Sphingomonadales bacterium]NCO49806.1 TIGR01244 family phosphatase [Sphingomonadales bacterium]NCP00689.1 TIGR01244 family phosphatase [Sphingomonadales bacterium]NCP25347.1 TIGR01244 family phosphatase [Sphingomonadales bacterium]NCP43904.1 TIGR01244 family phosphatase [Sphingomonadales bacterium]
MTSKPEIKKLNDAVSVSPQLELDDVTALANAGFQSIICNRPDDEAGDHPRSTAMAEAAKKAGLQFAYVPAVSGAITDQDGHKMAAALAALPAPVLAYCRSGARSTKLTEMAQTESGNNQSSSAATSRFNVVIVGGGSAGIATAASMLKRNRKISLAIIDPADDHYYQPGWTMVGGGAFSAEFTHRKEKDLIPARAKWIKSAVASFDPENNTVMTADGQAVGYDVLIVCPGIKLDWEAIDGLPETLGKNGVTSNYRFDLAPYTFRLVKELTSGTALFTQPPMPIKCAGAPQKAMYLSCSKWEKQGVLGDIDVQFHNAGAVLFGIKEYVPALMEYVERYNAHLNLESRLVAVDGPARIATFEQKQGEETKRVEVKFDMIHVVPPQTAPDFVRSSPLAADSGFVDVDPATLRHVKYANIFSLGDACSAPNAKTMAAVRKQAPIVAVNALAALEGNPPVADYDGYGSCPLTVERGKVVLAEFGYGGKLLPSFPNWLIDGTRPSRLSWLLKDTILPPVYWHGMLKGREWMVKPHRIGAE